MTAPVSPYVPTSHHPLHRSHRRDRALFKVEIRTLEDDARVIGEEITVIDVMEEVEEEEGWMFCSVFWHGELVKKTD